MDATLGYPTLESKAIQGWGTQNIAMDKSSIRSDG
jgi:serine protease inhibitor ecotin